MGKGFNLIIKIAKEVDKSNRRATKERERALVAQKREQLKQLREEEKEQKLTQRLYVQNNKENQKVAKIIAKEELEKLKKSEAIAFESRCVARKKAKEIIIKSTIK